ncbi:MAG: hypothetical protein O7A06_13515 [Acidobacteria bacterium]|nr:hypothetical protein [Acidobacteriota bacterium]
MRQDASYLSRYDPKPVQTPAASAWLDEFVLVIVPTGRFIQAHFCLWQVVEKPGRGVVAARMGL